MSQNVNDSSVVVVMAVPFLVQSGSSFNRSPSKYQRTAVSAGGLPATISHVNETFRRSASFTGVSGSIITSTTGLSARVQKRNYIHAHGARAGKSREFEGTRAPVHAPAGLPQNFIPRRGHPSTKLSFPDKREQTAPRRPRKLRRARRNKEIRSRRARDNGALLVGGVSDTRHYYTQLYDSRKDRGARSRVSPCHVSRRIVAAGI